MATYYIDYVGGNDVYGGTTKGTAWKRNPYMQGFGGTYSHSAGDHFIFKGGVTWPNACFRMYITNGGTSGAHDYYGVDQSWYTGASWSRPIFDMQSAVTTSVRNQVINSFSNSYIDFDSFEIINFYWDGLGSYGDAFIVMVYGSDHQTFNNFYIHNWTHHDNSDSTQDDLKLFVGNTGTSGWPVGNIIDHCRADGSATSDSGMFAYGGWDQIRFCTINDLSNGPVVLGNNGTGTFSIHDNVIYNIQESFWYTGGPPYHCQSIETSGPVTLYNNICYNQNLLPTTTTIIFTDPTAAAIPGFDLIYNNLVYGCQAGGIPLQIDCGAVSSPASCGSRIFNNTFIANGAPCIRVVKRTSVIGTAVIEDNHLVTDSGTFILLDQQPTNYTEDHDLKETVAQATAAGYTVGNLYQPTSLGSPTVDTGTVESTYFTTDIKGITRPQGAIWDIGCYEYNGGGGGGSARGKYMLVRKI